MYIKHNPNTLPATAIGGMASRALCFALLPHKEQYYERQKAREGLVDDTAHIHRVGAKWFGNRGYCGCIIKQAHGHVEYIIMCIYSHLQSSKAH